MNINNISAKNQESHGLSIFFSDLVDTCPLCHEGIKPVYVQAYCHSILNTSQTRVPSVLWINYRCPLNKCSELFMATFKPSSETTIQGNIIFKLKHLSPTSLNEKSFHNKINEVSPKFSVIYNQSLFAEQKKLDDICGPGYGKALEYLIKDFCIHLYQDKKEEIENKLLGGCINDYIEHSKIKSMAQRAAWLRNDETHYIRKWEETDIKDLKNLINITVSYIETELLAEQYEADMT
jgi:hypothetical protein